MSKEQAKKHDWMAWGQAVWVEVKRDPRAAALLSFKHVAQVAASEG